VGNTNLHGTCTTDRTDGEYTRFSLENLHEGDHSEYLRVDGRIILKSILNEQEVTVFTTFSRPSVQSSEYGNESEGSIELKELSDYQILKIDSAPLSWRNNNQ